MNDTVYRKDVIDTMEKIMADHPIDGYEDECQLINAMKSLPSAQTELEDKILVIGNAPTIEPEREKGEWEEIEVITEAYDITGVKTWASKMRCNQCGFTTFAIEGRFAQYNFCPNCGVDTRGEQE